MRILTLISRFDRNVEALARHFSMMKGFEVINWNPSVKSAFDAFDEFKPDMLLFNSSFNKLVAKVRLNYPNVKFICEDNTDNDENIYDKTFTTIINKDFVNKQYVNIGCDLASYINRTNKPIYQTHICFHGDMKNKMNVDQFQNMFNPATDVRINGCVKLYGINHGGEFACGVLSNFDQFAAYSQAKVCVFLKNWITPELYEAPFAMQNAIKVNQNVIHNIPECMTTGFYVVTIKEMLDTIQKLMVSTEKVEPEPVSNTLMACRDILGQEYTKEIEELVKDLTERYSL